jgi:plasmid maintenance system antidote protein VapI
VSSTLAAKIESANRSHLAREMGVDRSYISRVLTGHRGMSLDLALKLGRKFRVSVEDLAEYLNSRRDAEFAVDVEEDEVAVN